MPANDEMPAKLSARIDALPEGRAIYAVLSNMKSVKPVLLEPPAGSRRVALYVVADPGNLVTLGTIEGWADAHRIHHGGGTGDFPERLSE